jgi:hypothetical protein
MIGASAFKFQPIIINRAAPGGACVLRTFDDISAFIVNSVDIGHRLAPHWTAVRQSLSLARFGVRRAEVHEAMCQALAIEGWLDS